jgi:hypothetical protein
MTFALVTKPNPPRVREHFIHDCRRRIDDVHLQLVPERNPQDVENRGRVEK